jgi:hypothetical protein
MKIYVAGPYTAPTRAQTKENVQRAIDVGIELWKKGHFPLIPHLLHWVDLRAEELGVPMGWNDYMLWDAPWLDYCDALLLVAESKGALIELEHATDMGMMIHRSVKEVPAVKRAATWADIHLSE